MNRCRVQVVTRGEGLFPKVKVQLSTTITTICEFIPKLINNWVRGGREGVGGWVGWAVFKGESLFLWDTVVLFVPKNIYCPKGGWG